MNNVILEMRGITKTFPGVKALDNVNLTVREGDIHALCGENGAGKSTFMKVLSGVYPYGSYEGQIFYQGKERHFRDIADSEKLGIIIIHQELALVPLLSICENIFLGNEEAKFGVIDWESAERKTKALLEKVGLHESPETLIMNLGTGKQQLIEIAKALSKKVKLLILDEPTASLNENDSEALLGAPARVQVAWHHLHYHFAQAERDQESRGSNHDYTRRRDYRNTGHSGDQRRSDHQEHGRPRAEGSLSQARTSFGRNHL